MGIKDGKSCYDKTNEMRDILINTYCDFCNNYLTFEEFAGHNGLTEQEARELLELAGKVTLKRFVETL